MRLFSGTPIVSFIPVFLIALSGTVFAQTEAPSWTKAPPGIEMQKAFMEYNDKNADGKISKQEFRGTEENFKRTDKNGDGFITLDEAPSALRTAAFSPEGFFTSFDANGDGKVTFQEFPREHFEMMDQNKDGFITLEEARLRFNPPKQTVTMEQILFIGKRDKNKDGKVSKEEFQDPGFSNYDKNGDGFIEAVEAPGR